MVKYFKWVWFYESVAEGTIVKWILLSGLVNYAKVGDITRLSILGGEVFYRVGHAWSLLWYVNGWGRSKDAYEKEQER